MKRAGSLAEARVLWRAERDGRSALADFWCGAYRVPRKRYTILHPDRHRNERVLLHQNRQSAGGATYVRNGLLRMPGYLAGPRRDVLAKQGTEKEGRE